MNYVVVVMMSVMVQAIGFPNGCSNCLKADELPMTIDALDFRKPVLHMLDEIRTAQLNVASISLPKKGSFIR